MKALRPSRDRRRSEAGDTLVEILVALTIMGVAATAILLAFATTISGSGAQRNEVNLDTMLRTASDEVSAAIQQQSSAFASCAGAYVIDQNPSKYIPLPNSYSAEITQVEYESDNPADISPSSPTPDNYLFSPVYTQAQLPTTSCPSASYANSPQLLTISVTYSGSGGGTQTIQTVVDDPNPPLNVTTSCTATNPPSKLVFVEAPTDGPNGSAATAGSAFYPPAIVQIEDQNGVPCQNDAATVTLGITPGTGASGASLQNCTASSQLGQTIYSGCAINQPNQPGHSYTLTATDAVDGLSAISSPFDISQGVPAQLVFTTQPGNGTGGSPFGQPVVEIKDSQGDLVTSDTNTVTLKVGTNPGGGTLSGCTGSTVGGIARFTGCTIDKIGNGYTLTATDAGDNLTIPVASQPFNVTPGQPYRLAFTTTPGTTLAGDPFVTQPVVTLLDAGGNTATVAPGSTDTVGLAIGTNPSGGTLSGCTETTTAGVATFTGCSINNSSSNPYTLVATDKTNTAVLSATSGPFDIATATLTSFKIAPSTGSYNETAGTSFNVTITALNQDGQTYTSFGGTGGTAECITFSGPASSPAPSSKAAAYPAAGGCTSGSSVTFVNGVGTASINLYDAATTTLTATQALVTGTSGSFTVSPGGAASFGVAVTSPQTAGTAFSPTITALDTYSNTAKSYGGTGGTAECVTFSGPANSPAPTNKAPAYPAKGACATGSSVTFTNGVASPSITLYDAASGVTLTATTSAGTALTGTSAGFTVNPGGPSKFTVPTPAAQTAGTAFNETVTALDAYANVDTSFGGATPGTAECITFSGPASSPAPSNTAPAYPAAGGCTSGSSVTFVNGVGTASINLYDAATTTLTATQALVTGTSGSFTVSPGGAASFGVAVTSPQTAGTAFSPTITALDTYSNTAKSYGGTGGTAECVTFSGPANSPAPDQQGPRLPGQGRLRHGLVGHLHQRGGLPVDHPL